MEGGTNGNVVSYKHIFKSHQEFDYNPKDNHIFSLFSGKAVDIQKSDIENENNIHVREYNEDEEMQQFSVLYTDRWESTMQTN
jgi:hypothetical protein